MLCRIIECKTSCETRNTKTELEKSHTVYVSYTTTDWRGKSSVTKEKGGKGQSIVKGECKWSLEQDYFSDEKTFLTSYLFTTTNRGCDCVCWRFHKILAQLDLKCMACSLVQSSAPAVSVTSWDLEKNSQTQTLYICIYNFYMDCCINFTERWILWCGCSLVLISDTIKSYLL